MNTISRSRPWNALGLVLLGAATALLLVAFHAGGADLLRGLLLWLLLLGPLFALHEGAHVAGYRRAGVPRERIVRRATWVAVEGRIGRAAVLRGIGAPLCPVAALALLAAALSLAPAGSPWLDAAGMAAWLLALAGLAAAWGDVYWLLRVSRHLPATEYRDEGRRLVVYPNGRSIPLLCTCCGKHLLLKDAAAFRANVVGLYLDALDHDPEGPAEAIQFIFAPTLSGGLAGARPAEEDLWFLNLHLDSVRQIEQVQPGARRPPARKRPRKQRKRKRR